MTDLQTILTDETANPAHPYRRPRDAATLILLDRSGPKPKVLLGRRHHGHVFMAGKYVFPGGRVEAADRYAPVAAPLDPGARDHLLNRTRRFGAAKAQAVALAAIRETFEETGLLVGRAGAPAGRVGKLVAASPWKGVIDAGFLPDLSQVAFVARAITPTGRSRRFDTRFFTADTNAIIHRVDGVVGPDSELVELVWVPVNETLDLDLPGVTRRVLKEVQERISGGFGHDLPVPFFHTIRGKLVREVV